MIVEYIDKSSPLLKRVKQLGRKNSKTLGFFPDGAFDDHASRRQILVALSERGDLTGYLLYRVVRRGSIWPAAVIVHLCVDEEHRKKRVARALIEELRHATKDQFLKIELKCRRDYGATDLWPKLGFVYKGETAGRGGLPLLKWEMVFRRPPLIELLHRDSAENRLRAVIDANILYRLQDASTAKNNRERLLEDEVRALQADWLTDEVAVVITDETCNEIQRNENALERQRRLSFAQGFEILTADVDEVSELERQLGALLTHKQDDSFVSDLRQLAYAILNGAEFFITQDTGLLKKSDIVRRGFGITILSPGQFIGRIDELIRDVEYEPVRLAGSHAIESTKVRSDQLASLYTPFRLGPEETRNQFDMQLRDLLAHPNRFTVELCAYKGSGALCLVAYDRGDVSHLGIPMLRASRSPFAGTVLRYLLRKAVISAARESRPFVSVSCIQRDAAVKQALDEAGYTATGDRWVKCGLHIAENSSNVVAALGQLREEFPAMSDVMDRLIGVMSAAAEHRDTLILADVERRLWPTKILDIEIPNYVVPIKPVYAQHLFDEDIARATLWGAREDLALGNENVYYRAKTSSYRITSPARILWYVTRDDDYQGSMRVRACSLLEEVAVGSAKDLFRRFQRLGIYEWRDILRTASNKSTNHIMALRFSNSEVFSQPLTFAAVSQILQEEEGRVLMLQSPQRILPRTFARIYRMASGLEKVSAS